MNSIHHTRPTSCWPLAIAASAWFMVIFSMAMGQAQETAVDHPATEPPSATRRLGELELPLVFEEDFEQGRARWETTDDGAWELRAVEQRQVFGLNRRQSNYQPPFRSPHNIALIRKLELADFVLMVDVRNTADTGGHRDCCIFFVHRSPSQFYYAHLGAKPDPASGQIMIVSEAPRRPLTENQREIPWDDRWHRVKLTREAASGAIAVYFDDMETPVMQAIDKTFERGRLGIGSFDDMNEFDNVRIYGR